MHKDRSATDKIKANFVFGSTYVRMCGDKNLPNMKNAAS